MKVATQYEPFLIANMTTGLYLKREPWLLPKDAFETLSNCHLKNGVLEKRRGYAQFGRFAHTDLEQDTSPNGTETSFSGTISNTPLRAGDFDVQDVTLNDDSTETFTDNSDGTVTGDNGATGTYNTTSGGWTLDFSNSLPPKNGTNIDIHYDHYPGNTIMGLWNYLTSGGSQELIAFDTKRMCKWNTDSEKFDDKAFVDGSSDIDFSGDNTNYFWMQNWEMPAGTFKAYICNNTSTTVSGTHYGLFSYNGTSLSAVNVDTDNDGNNEIETCLMAFIYHNRLILLRTNESGTGYNQRVRYSALNDPTDWREDISGHGGHKDAPVEDWIIAADFIGGDLIVFFERSVFKLNYTGDSTDPFDWEKIDSTEGVYSTYGVSSFSDELQAVGPTRIIATDGRDVYGIDDKIPDFLLQWRQNGIEYCYSLVMEEMKQTLLAYPSKSASVNADGNYYPDSVLVLNYTDNSYSTYSLPVHVLGYSSLQSDLTMDDISSTWDEIDWAWDDRELQAGYPTTLMGSRDGWVYKLNYGGSDNGSAIEFNAKGGLWNPYSKAGLKAHLGYIDFLVDVGTEKSFDVECFINTKDAAFQTKTVECTAVHEEGDKVWKRVYVNAIAAGHRINITNNDTGNRPRIHAMIPWFKPAGGLLG